MKVVFLDIDGVICTPAEIYRDPNGPDTSMDQMVQVNGDWLHHFNAECVRLLNAITDKTGAKLVISSTWRNRGLETLGIHFKNEGVTGEIVGKTPWLFDEDRKHKERGYEIQDWLDRHPEVTKFVILDDDSDMVHLMPYLVHTYFRDWEEKGLPEGLAQEHVDKAISMLED